MPLMRPYRAPALEKGLEILEFLAPQPGPVTLSEISAGLGRSKSELYRMLQVLEERGYLRRAPGTEGYQLSNRLFMLGMEHPPVKGLMEVAPAHMHELADAILQPCHLAVASEEFIVVIARVESPHDIGFMVRVGHRRPIPHSTSGLVLFAFQSESVREQWLQMLERKAVTFTRKRMISAARTIRTRGYVSIASEVVGCVTDLSAPIVLRGTAIAALTVPFVERRGANKAAREQAIGRLCAAAERISRTLDHGA